MHAITIRITEYHHEKRPFRNASNFSLVKDAQKKKKNKNQWMNQSTKVFQSDK
mgnify:CR=1 FL=1